MAEIKIIIAAHKEYPMPTDEIYLPVHVGSEGKQPLPYQPDCQGENISAKNPGYCELTGLYWAWKNLSCDYLGLAHYRRHFTRKSKGYRRSHPPMDCVLTGQELLPLLAEGCILVPKRRRYYISTLYEHYGNSHYAEHLDVTREILAEHFPLDLAAFDRVMAQTGGYMFNMFIMEKTLADDYCAWLFAILAELEARLPKREYTPYQARFYGRISELLFNVWLLARGLPVKEIGYLPMEKEPWGKKGAAFLKSKLGKKYEGSF